MKFIFSQKFELFITFDCSGEEIFGRRDGLGRLPLREAARTTFQLWLDSEREIFIIDQAST